MKKLVNVSSPKIVHDWKELAYAVGDDINALEDAVNYLYSGQLKNSKKINTVKSIAVFAATIAVLNTFSTEAVKAKLDECEKRLGLKE